MPGTCVKDVTNSSVTGNAGTREFFLHVLLGKECGPVHMERLERAVQKAKELEEYKK